MVVVVVAVRAGANARIGVVVVGNVGEVDGTGRDKRRNVLGARRVVDKRKTGCVTNIIRMHGDSLIRSKNTCESSTGIRGVNGHDRLRDLERSCAVRSSAGDGSDDFHHSPATSCKSVERATVDLSGRRNERPSLTDNCEISELEVALRCNGFIGDEREARQSAEALVLAARGRRRARRLGALVLVAR